MHIGIYTPRAVMAQITVSVVTEHPCLFLKAQFQTCAVFSYLLNRSIVCKCHKSYNDKNNALLTSFNDTLLLQKRIAYVLRHASSAGMYAEHKRKCCVAQ